MLHSYHFADRKQDTHFNMVNAAGWNDGFLFFFFENGLSIIQLFSNRRV